MKKIILILLLLPLIASSQSFNVFDIDTSEYPIIKAKFYSVDENGDQILNHTTSDFEITENGNPAEVLSVSCPEPKQDDEIYSIAMSIDISGSMKGVPIELGKITANDIVCNISSSKFKIALQQCNDKANILNDFINNYDKVKENIERIEAGGDNDFVEQLLNPNTGLLNIAKNGEGNRIAIIYTDAYWEPMTADEMKQAIDICKYNDIKLYTILYTKPEAKPNGIKASLKEISEESGGRFYDGVTSFDLATLTAFIVTSEYGNDPCEITWNSTLTCYRSLSIEILNKSTNLKLEKQIRLSNSQYLNLISNMYLVDFGTNSTDTTITITANNGTQTINEIYFEPQNDSYEVLTPLPITIPSNNSVELALRYTSKDDERIHTKMVLVSNYCISSIGILEGDREKPLSIKTLELTHPNGGEEFIAGTDTLITWKGVSLEEKMKLRFSYDNGRSWTPIFENSFGKTEYWSLPNLESDSCLIRIDQTNPSKKTGSLNWMKTMGGSSEDKLVEVILTMDNGYLIGGTSKSDNFGLGYLNNKGQEDVFILKLDISGNIEWMRNYGGSDTDIINSIIQLPNGDIVVSGSSRSVDGDLINSESRGIDSEAWVFKLNPVGDIIWSRSYGGSNSDEAVSIISNGENELIFTGNSASFDRDLYKDSTLTSDNIWACKLSSNGEIVWSKLFGGSKYDYSKKIVQSSDGGYVIAGGSNSEDGDLDGIYRGSSDILLLKISNDGVLETSTTYGGSKNDYLSSMILTSDGGYVIAGGSYSEDGDLKELENKQGNLLVAKFGSDGSNDFSKLYGGSGNDNIKSLIQTKDEGFFIVGNSTSSDGDLENKENNGGEDVWIVKLDQFGELEWSNTFGSSKDDIANSVLESINLDIIMVGSYGADDFDFDIYGNKGKSDVWMMNINPNVPLQSDTSDAVFSIIMPEPVIQNNDIDMGEMIVGNTKDTIVSSVICNTGDAPLHVLGVDITGGDAADFLIPRGAGDFYLEKDQCQDMMFEFTPFALGNRTAVATIRTTIGDFTDTINIRGVGINPLIEATTDVVDFGQFELGEGKDTNVVLIKNVGVDDITITETKITGPDMEQFDMVPLPSFTLVSGDDKELELNYTSIYGGRTSSIIEFHYDGVGSPLRSMLFAEGIGGEVYPQVPDAYVGDRVELGLHLGRIKPEGLDEVATNFSATVSYNSTLLAPIDKNMTVTTENTTSFIEIEGQLSGVSQIATVPMKVGLGTAVKSGLVVTEFQLYDANGDSVDYEIEPGVGEFNILGICEEGGTRLINPNGEKVGLRVAQNKLNTSATIYLDLIESGQTDLVIYDQLGNAIETAYSGTPSTGSKELSLDLSNYTNGRYYIKLTTPTITKTEIIEVVR
jgi:hypothetical protein